MRRLTTPTHTFVLPFDSSVVLRFLLTYVQNDVIILEKNENQVEADGNVYSVELTQEETKKFRSGPAFAQIRVLTVDGNAIASEPIKFAVTPVYNEEVLT